MSSVRNDFRLKTYSLYCFLNLSKFWCRHCKALWNSSPLQPGFGGIEVKGPQDELVSLPQVDTNFLLGFVYLNCCGVLEVQSSDWWVSSF